MLRIHRALPLKLRLDLVREVTAETELVKERRADGGIMSCRADRRSRKDSLSSSSSDWSEISDSGYFIVG